ncbi:uncharacterized protein CTRU02_215688 [Colletotrichum truncatum]|uniref:Uncharacterized protein n=1 Tax=Colletotrichum truncatum TaxID=5467 RepID=A0ACC3YBX1_COLTU|nr:uncharacterized protein CTRU02_15121 [Colletotrichum truncatum]KAF6781414.1 hypothetical protein CTRU02_15121 [Colletotrichum truncatum]
MKPVDIPAIQPCLCPSRHLKVHLDADTVVSPKDLPWATALHIALAHSHLETASLLVERGANWTSEPFGARGVTALMIICANDLIRFLDYLLEWAARPGVQQHWNPRNWDINGHGYSDYLAAVGNGPTRRLLERRLKALEKRLTEHY